MSKNKVSASRPGLPMADVSGSGEYNAISKKYSDEEGMYGRKIRSSVLSAEALAEQPIKELPPKRKKQTA